MGLGRMTTLRQWSVFGEGYATYAEVSNIPTGAYSRVIWNERRLDYRREQPLNLDETGILSGLALFSRLASRQTMSSGMTYPPITASYPKLCRVFAEEMGAVNTGFMRRFVHFGALQQATYAVGLIQVIVSVNLIK